jgi:hypothetical protein
MKHLFLEHPASVGESYWQHMGQAMRFWYLALSNRIRLPVSWTTAVSFQGYRQ